MGVLRQKSSKTATVIVKLAALLRYFHSSQSDSILPHIEVLAALVSLSTIDYKRFEVQVSKQVLKIKVRYENFAIIFA